MGKKFKLPRTVQCAKCPWKTSTDPFEIPDGYDIEKHRALISTIARPGEINLTAPVMACHHSTGDDQMFCVGWLNHQLTIGNNIAIRIKMIDCENLRDLRTVGEQHVDFADTIPNF